MGKKESAEWINSNGIQCQVTITECVWGVLKNVLGLLKTMTHAAKCVVFADLRAGFLRCVGFFEF